MALYKTAVTFVFYFLGLDSTLTLVQKICGDEVNLWPFLVICSLASWIYRSQILFDCQILPYSAILCCQGACLRMDPAEGVTEAEESVDIEAKQDDNNMSSGVETELENPESENPAPEPEYKDEEVEKELENLDAGNRAAEPEHEEEQEDEMVEEDLDVEVELDDEDEANDDEAKGDDEKKEENLLVVDELDNDDKEAELDAASDQDGEII